MVRNNDFIEHDVNDIGVIPDALCRQNFTANNHSVDCISIQQVPANQRTLVISVVIDLTDKASHTSRITHPFAIERVGIHVDRCAFAVSNDVIDDDRLSPSHEDRSRGVKSTSSPDRFALATRSVGVVDKHGINDTSLSLMNFNRIETRKRSFDFGNATAVREEAISDACRTHLTNEDATPIARLGQAEVNFFIVVISVKRRSRTVSIVPSRRKDNLSAVTPLRDQLTAELHIDVSCIQFDNDPWID